jgi:hypothetical protein
MWDAIIVGLLFFFVGSQNLWDPKISLHGRARSCPEATYRNLTICGELFLVQSLFIEVKARLYLIQTKVNAALKYRQYRL